MQLVIMILFIWGQCRLEVIGIMRVNDHLEVEDAEKLIAVHAHIAANILQLDYTSLYSNFTCTHCIVQYCSDI